MTYQWGYIDADYTECVNKPRDDMAFPRHMKVVELIKDHDRNIVNPNWPGIIISDEPLPNIIDGSMDENYYIPKR